MRSTVEVLNNQGHVADMKQKDLHQQAPTVTFIQHESGHSRHIKAQIKTVSSP